MGIRGGSPMPGNVLEHRQNAALLQPLRHGTPDGCDFVRPGSIGPIANDGIGARDGHIRQRQTIDRNSQARKVRRDQPGAQSGRGHAERGLDVVKHAKGRSRRIKRPVRRTEPLHPAALLVDQNRSLGVADRPTQFLNKTNYLRRRFNVPFE